MKYFIGGIGGIALSFAVTCAATCIPPQPPPKTIPYEDLIGPPPSHLEIYKDGQGVWHIIVDGDRVCSCRPY